MTKYLFLTLWENYKLSYLVKTLLYNCNYSHSLIWRYSKKNLSLGHVLIFSIATQTLFFLVWFMAYFSLFFRIQNAEQITSVWLLMTPTWTVVMKFSQSCSILIQEANLILLLSGKACYNFVLNGYFQIIFLSIVKNTNVSAVIHFNCSKTFHLWRFNVQVCLLPYVQTQVVRELQLTMPYSSP